MQGGGGGGGEQENQDELPINAQILNSLEFYGSSPLSVREPPAPGKRKRIGIPGGRLPLYTIAEMVYHNMLPKPRILSPSSRDEGWVVKIREPGTRTFKKLDDEIILKKTLTPVFTYKGKTYAEVCDLKRGLSHLLSSNSSGFQLFYIGGKSLAMWRIKYTDSLNKKNNNKKKGEYIESSSDDETESESEEDEVEDEDEDEIKEPENKKAKKESNIISSPPPPPPPPKNLKSAWLKRNNAVTTTPPNSSITTTTTTLSSSMQQQPVTVSIKIPPSQSTTTTTTTLSPPLPTPKITPIPVLPTLLPPSNIVTAITPPPLPSSYEVVKENEQLKAKVEEVTKSNKHLKEKIGLLEQNVSSLKYIIRMLQDMKPTTATTTGSNSMIENKQTL